MFPMGSLSFQASQSIRTAKDMSVGTDTIKCFLGKLGEGCSFKKRLDSQHDIPISMNSPVDEVMETKMAGENDSSTQDPIGTVTDKDGLMELFDKFPGLSSPMSDCLEPDTTIVISEASLQGKSSTYQVTIQNLVTTLLDMGKYVSCFGKFFVITLNTSIINSTHT